MSTFVEFIGPAMWRASWQAAVLAVLVAVLLRLLGNSLAPKWKYLLLALVILRLAIVWTPASPTSLFNLLSPASSLAAAESNPRSHHPGAELATVQVATAPDEFERVSHSPSMAAARIENTAEDALAVSAVAAPVSAPPPRAAERDRSFGWPGLLVVTWLIGVAASAWRIFWQWLVLNRRLRACRLVNDERLLSALEQLRPSFGLRRSPTVLATPAAISPCVAGFWKPRIVLPEALLTERSEHQQRHVLAHELAHVARRDLRANWLMLGVRAFHWLNPTAWWALSRMRHQCETASDDLAIVALGENERHAYAATMLELAASLLPPPVSPGMIGLSSSSDAMRNRMNRLLASPQRPLNTAIAFALLLIVAGVGLTDARFAAQASPATPPVAADGQAVDKAADQKPNAAATSDAGAKPPATKGTFVIEAQCVDETDKTPLAGVSLTLIAVEGVTQLRRQLAETRNDAEGKFRFEGLEPPRQEAWLNPLTYQVLARAPDRPVAVLWSYRIKEDEPTLRIARTQGTLSGRVTDDNGAPVSGAAVISGWISGQPMPDDPLYARTNADGTFEIRNVPVGRFPEIHFRVVHPDYPPTSASVPNISASATVVLTKGCILTGVVHDANSAAPVGGAIVTATNISASPRRTNHSFEFRTLTDAAGRYRVAVPEGQYNVSADMEKQVSVALLDRECLVGTTVELPVLELQSGGIISGRVINTKTGETMKTIEDGQPIMLGLLGPSNPNNPSLMSPKFMAAVGPDGQFQLRAAAGENFPYLTNFHGDRMIWDTLKQPAVIVKEGETTTYDMLVTPKATAEEKLQAGRDVVAALPAEPAQRIQQIIAGFRKLNHTVDQTETWCPLMREAVALGKDAVPPLCAALDSTTENRMQRRLGFALRAIGDPRAVPALIRAIPRALQPASSDYGLIVEDAELAKFMRDHQIEGPGGSGTYFSFGRPEREIFAALQKLTGRQTGETRSCSLSLSEDPRRAMLQRRILLEHAQEWQTWWEANWRSVTNDSAYELVKLDTEEPPVPPVAALTPGSKLVGEVMEAVLSPAGQGGRYFYDLDTGYQPGWPAHIAQDEQQIDEQPLEAWAAENGVDLMCVTHRADDGTETFVLRALGMQVSEISESEARLLESTIKEGRLPEGRNVGPLLMHYDSERQHVVADANGSYLYTTRDGNRGVIEVTDRVTQAQNLAGIGGPPRGVGFHKGVRFDLKAIVPK